MAEKKDPMDKDVDALLNIIREKDNLIVSIKESSTRRDKLNEQQIRMLAEDNSRKLMQVKSLSMRVREVEANLAKSQAELSLFKVTEGKLSSKVEEFKAAFESYKSQVRSSLDSLKLAIQDELGKREEYKNKLLDDMKANYAKLETQLQGVDDHYKEIIAEISKKQGTSKKYIRHALNDLQEALSMLDIAHADFIQPTKIIEDSERIAEESQALFNEFRDMKGLPGGTTLIKNIENVTVKLGAAPKIDGIFQEISTITSGSRDKVEKMASETLGGRKGAGDQASAGVGKGSGSGAAGKGTATQAGEDQGDAKKKIDSPEQKAGGKEGAGKGGSIGGERTKAEEEAKKKKKFGEDVQEVVFKRGRNYAPFNWQEILSDIQLKRFQSFIQSCIKAEKSGNLLKALQLYKTIREQPGISETIAGRLLDDHIEYLEDLIKRKYSIQYQ
ncbi:MAG: hypothetical protein JW827_10645 [Spirochaetes bacterium]|nr:hypothetical protein [Spirochaetota bacterium]